MLLRLVDQQAGEFRRGRRLEAEARPVDEIDHVRRNPWETVCTRRRENLTEVGHKDLSIDAACCKDTSSR